MRNFKKARRLVATVGFIPALSPLLPGCKSADSAAPGVTKRDSAGIVIVENPAGMERNAGGWGVEDRPFLSIGSLEGSEDTSLHDVTGAHALSDGRVAILNAGSREIRIYDEAATLVRTIGRAGEGPGEFQYMSLGGVLPGDTMVILDPALRRISLVHPEAGVVRSARLDPEVSDNATAWGIFDNRTLLFGRGGTSADREGVYRGVETYRVSDLAGRLVGELGEKPGSEANHIPMNSYTTGEPVIITRVLYFARQGLPVASGDRFYFGSQDRFEIEAMDSQGTLLRLVRVMEDPVPLTRELWDTYVEHRIRTVARDADHERRMRRLMEENSQHLPPAFPAHGALEVDALGYLWVEEYRIPGELTHVWSVFNRDGVRLARVTLPVPMEVLEIGEDYFLGLVKDEYDVEYVQLFRLRRG
ncbi:MAG: hypothetical protein ACWGSQ_09680 [Longimicrobiales bacterium]